MKFVKKIDADTVEVQRDKKLTITREQVEKRIAAAQNQIVESQKILADWQTILTKF